MAAVGAAAGSVALSLPLTALGASALPARRLEEVTSTWILLVLEPRQRRPHLAAFDQALRVGPAAGPWTEPAAAGLTSELAYRWNGRDLGRNVMCGIRSRMFKLDCIACGQRPRPVIDLASRARFRADKRARRSDRS